MNFLQAGPQKNHWTSVPEDGLGRPPRSPRSRRCALGCHFGSDPAACLNSYQGSPLIELADAVHRKQKCSVEQRRTQTYGLNVNNRIAAFRYLQSDQNRTVIRRRAATLSSERETPMHSKSQVKRSTRIPLEITETTETAEDGTVVRIVRHRRGAFVRESRKYNSLGRWLHELAVPPRVEFERICDGIRDRLEESGLPSDRTPKWTRENGGEWHPYSGQPKPKPNTSYALWTKRIDDQTEELTIERAAGKLLWDLTQLLNRKDIDDHLWHIGQLIESYAAFRILGPIADAAAAGLLARKGRAKGPATRQQKTTRVREAIWSAATLFWAENPKFEGDASNTAAHIADNVNQLLDKHGLLPAKRKRLSTKTIGDHIRAGIREGKF